MRHVCTRRDEGVMLTLVWIEFFELLFAMDNVGATSNGYVPRPKRKEKKKEEKKPRKHMAGLGTNVVLVCSVLMTISRH